jgi:hypothetical protein
MNPKHDAEELMNAVLPFAERMLGQYGEFFPFGGYLRQDGTVVQVGATDAGSDRPRSTDLIYILRSSLQEVVRTEQCKATAIVFEVAVMLPGSDRKSDAIQICVDHTDNYSAEVFFPYQIIGGRVVYGETFAQSGKNEMFA